MGSVSLNTFTNLHTITSSTINMVAAAVAPKAVKAKAPKAPAAHPKYSVMIAAAITALKDRTGSSRQAILKHICANNKVDAAKAAIHLRMALKRGVAKGAHKMARATGKGAGSYKLAEKAVVKKPKAKKVVKKPAVKKPKAKKAVKKPAAKKAAAKKVAKKPAAKKPAAKKVAKKPAAKKAAPKKK